MKIVIVRTAVPQLDKLKLATARREVALRLPYFTSLLLSIVWRSSPGLGTFAMTRHGIMLADPVVLLEWEKEHPLKVAFVTAHEAMHWFLRHCLRGEQLDVVTDWQRMLWNIALDALVNKMLQPVFDGWVPDDAVMPDKLKLPLCLPPEVRSLVLPNECVTTEQAYLWLLDNVPEPEPPKREPDSGGAEDSEDSDQSDEQDDETGNSGPGGDSAEQDEDEESEGDEESAVDSDDAETDKNQDPDDEAGGGDEESDDSDEGDAGSDEGTPSDDEQPADGDNSDGAGDQEEQEAQEEPSQDREINGHDFHPCAGGGFCGSVAGNPLPNEPDGSDPEGRDDAEVDIIVRETAMQMEQLAQRGAGKLPGMLSEEVQRLLHPKGPNWDAIFAREFSSCAEIIQGDVDYAYGFGLSLLQAGLGYDGPILPKLIARQIKVMFVLDTSGSMGTRELEEGVGHANNIMTTLSSEITFMACDAKVHALTRVKDWREVAKNIKGRGGTSFVPIFEEVEKLKEKPDVIVIGTDGQGPAPANPPLGIKVIWLLMGAYQQKPSIEGQWSESIDWGTFINVPYEAQE